MKPNQSYVFEFGSFRVDPTERILQRNGAPVHLTDKAFDALLVLIQRPGHLVERSELIAAIWGEAFVQEANLTVTISMLRKALDEQGNDSRYIETVPRRGYRFVADIRRINALESDSGVSGGIPPGSLSWVKSFSRLVWGFSRSHKLTALAFALFLIGLTSTASFVRFHRAKADRVDDRPLGVAPLSIKSANSGSRTRDWEAYRLYSEGRYFWSKRTQEGLRQSIKLFQQAIARDPEYAEAYVGMAESYMQLPSFGMEPAEESYSSAKAAVLKALQLDKSLPEAHRCLGVLSFVYEWNWSTAESEFHHVLEVEPDDAVALFEHAKALAAMGRLDESLEEARRAQRFDPASIRINNELGRIYYWHRNYDEAISTFHHVLELDPDYWRARTRLGRTYLAQGKYSEAVHEIQEGRRLAGENPYIDGLLGYAEALSGDTNGAHRILAELRQRSLHEYVPAFSMVLISLGVGDRQQAIHWLSKAYEVHSEHLAYAKIDPLFDPFRSDPQFVDLLNRMGLSNTGTATMNLGTGPLFEAAESLKATYASD